MDSSRSVTVAAGPGSAPSGHRGHRGAGTGAGGSQSAEPFPRRKFRKSGEEMDTSTGFLPQADDIIVDGSTHALR